MRSKDDECRLPELLRRRRPPTYEETTANALAAFTPTPNIRHRENRVPIVLPTDPAILKLMRKFSIIE
ncbi:hypothetical protein CF326_g4798 [Tilletia indica]|nr:hypothetical protein CF326_g4798 [Tilletia indica]